MNPSLPFLLLALAAAPLLSGCQRLAANYVLDPRAPSAAYADLKPLANPGPVLLSFEMRRADGSFAQGQAHFAPRLARIVERSGLFSSVAQVGHESMPRLQVVLAEMAAATGTDLKSLPPALSSGLPGSEAALLYLFTASYEAPGKPPVRKVYPHAIHVLRSGVFPPAGTQALSGNQATDAMLEGLTLNFLRELQADGKL
ncbi:MAG: hypothetical protein RJA22_1620 [Verrucomicrobiota bacterium]|jgi:hypothetical protein